jgi:hypothetical protein
MSMARLLILLFFTCASYACAAQADSMVHTNGPAVEKQLEGYASKYRFYRQDTDSGVYIIQLSQGNCKGYLSAPYFFPAPHVREKAETVSGKTKFLTVKGNITYNFSYRSYIDTPFAQADLMQHLVLTSLNFTLKDKYPVRMTISSRSSNSPYFRNAMDVNVEFSRRQLMDNIKNDLGKKAGGMVDTAGLATADKLYVDRQRQAQQLQAWVNSPVRLQEMAAEKNYSLRGNLPPAPTVKTNDLPGMNEVFEGQGERKDLYAGRWKKANQRIDSASRAVKDSAAAFGQNKLPVKDSSHAERYNAKKQQLAKMVAELKSEETKLKQRKKAVQDSVSKFKGEINNLATAPDLYAFMKRNNIPREELTKAQRLLLSVNKIGIGRSWIDYSELTVKNVSLAGVNIEMNPGRFYFAAAAGKINYRFRDFIIKNNNDLPDQSLFLLRAGAGHKEKNYLIFTFYNGKKSVLNAAAANGPFAVQRVLGVSAEAKMAIDGNNYIIAEVAKSSYNNNAAIQPPASDLMKKALNLKVHTNEAYSIKLFSQHPATDTRLTANYKKIGENFQSYNLYPVNVNQDAWMVRVNQYLWKRKFAIDAAIRKNDFISPIAVPSSFSSKTVFKSIQASLRIPKYPFVAIGYYPSSQLSLVNNNVLVENQYNTFNAVISHSYQLWRTGMNSNAVYTKFYNNSSDTAFLYYNASSYTFNHSIFLSAFTFQSGIAVTDQKQLHLFTLEQSATYKIKNNLSLTAGLKWNRLNRKEDLYGGTAAMSVYLKKFGTVQLNYDKTFLPGYNKILMPVDIGRMTFYRTF